MRCAGGTPRHRRWQKSWIPRQDSPGEEVKLFPTMSEQESRVGPPTEPPRGRRSRDSSTVPAGRGEMPSTAAAARVSDRRRFTAGDSSCCCGVQSGSVSSSERVEVVLKGTTNSTISLI